ncbi:MAG: type IV pilus secretin PilQ [Nitrospirae bacterium]|nr:type IV pilus secretin PilQ [Nitrospirota bacterium]
MKRKVFLIILGAVVLVGCASQPAEIKSPDTEPTATTTITDVIVTDLPDASRIALKGNGPLNYTAFKLEEPLELIIDLSGANLGVLAAPRDVGLDPVKEIVPEQAADAGGTSRLSFMLSRDADYLIHREEDGTLLTIDFSKQRPVEAMAQPPAAEEVAPSQPTPPVQSAPTPATPQPRITSVQIVPQRAFVDVRIEADGPIVQPRIFSLGNNRLVVDLPDTRSAVKPAVIKADTNTLVRQARIGQHQDPMKVRVVLDLKRAVEHSVEARGNSLTVRLTRTKLQAPAAPAPKTTELPVPAPKPAEPPAPQVQASSAPVNPPADEAEAEAAPASVAQPSVEVPEVPPVVSSAGAAGAKTLGTNGYSGQKISLDFQDAEVSNVLRLIADVSGLNMVVGEEVKGKVTLKLFNVPWDQSLDITLKSKGLGQVREGNIIRIDTNANIAKQQDEAAKAKEAQVKAEDLKTLIIPINYAKAADLSTTLKKNLSSRGELTVNEATNSLIAKDVPQNIADIQQLIKLLDLPTPQVLIETRIVQANTNFARDLGVQWGLSAKDTFGGNQLGLNAGPSSADPFGGQVSNFAINLPASGGAGSVGNLGFTLGHLTGRNPFNLDVRLSAGEASGETKIISSPRVVTLDNREAVIQQGDSVPFETVSDKGTQTQFVDATLNLTVTPHITPNGSVIMKIKATKNAIGDFRSRLGAPSISKREAATEVMVQDGETTVIGGIFETSKSETETGVPWLAKIPGLGWLFKRQSVSDQNRELLIFITPTVVKKS